MGLGEPPQSSCQPSEQGRERRRSRCGVCATRASLLRSCGAGEVPVGEPVGLKGNVASSTQTQLGNKTFLAPLWAGGLLRCLTGRRLSSKLLGLAALRPASRSRCWVQGPKPLLPSTPSGSPPELLPLGFVPAASGRAHGHGSASFLRGAPVQFQFPNEKQRMEALQMGRPFMGSAGSPNPVLLLPLRFLGIGSRALLRLVTVSS